MVGDFLRIVPVRSNPGLARLGHSRFRAVKEVGTMPNELVDHNGHVFTCTVNSDARGSTIHLKNTETGDEWTCSVTCDNINKFWALPTSEGSILTNLPRAAVGIMQDVLHRGTTGRCYGTASLVYKYSPFYMELRVKGVIRQVGVELAFENDAAIEKSW
ncbi:hypothetical protein PF011_g3368 [Phytophthora fragariae]|uniref:Uncharacterized protein n=1 Tax=Phytophthora fragariae TaxID=53985 RepID=A0A6A3M8W0_9STRA|nr:hypothetical protein PF011_g3368 [Phytophthora fragariae]